jgi:hypothetical protein
VPSKDGHEVPSKDGLEGNPIPVGIGFLGIQYTYHGLAWDRLGDRITKVVSEALAVASHEFPGIVQKRRLVMLPCECDDGSVRK